MTIKINIEHVNVGNAEDVLFARVGTEIYTFDPGTGGSIYVTNEQSIEFFRDRRGTDRRRKNSAMPYIIKQVTVA